MNKLDYFIHDGADALRFEITGDLSWPAVTTLDQAWRTFSSEGIVGAPVPMIGNAGRTVAWPRISNASWAAWRQLLPAGERQCPQLHR